MTSIEVNLHNIYYTSCRYNNRDQDKSSPVQSSADKIQSYYRRKRDSGNSFLTNYTQFSIRAIHCSSLQRDVEED